MIDLFQVAYKLQAFCDGRGWRSCFIGGIASRGGVSRSSLAMSILPCLLDLALKIALLSLCLLPILQELRMREFAQRYRVLLLRSPDGVGMDISLGGLPFEEDVIRRATTFPFEPGLEIRTCSAEDLIVMKLFASRPLDIHDAEGVVFRHKNRLDWLYIEDQLSPLAEVKQQPEMIQTLIRLRQL